MSLQLMQGDCMELMQSLPEKSIDLIFTDLPYGTTRNAFDVPLPLKDYICIGKTQYAKQIAKWRSVWIAILHPAQAGYLKRLARGPAATQRTCTDAISGQPPAVRYRKTYVKSANSEADDTANTSLLFDSTLSSSGDLFSQGEPTCPAFAAHFPGDCADPVGNAIQDTARTLYAQRKRQDHHVARNYLITW